MPVAMPVAVMVPPMAIFPEASTVKLPPPISNRADGSDVPIPTFPELVT